MAPETGFGLADAGLATVGALLATVTLAVPGTPPLAAVTVNVPAVEPALNRPLASMVPPPLTDQVKAGVIDAPN